jgi:hypothetical protein
VTGTVGGTLRRMDRDRFSAIGHRGLSILNPIPSDALDRAIRMIGELSPPRTALDIGCGKAELPIRLSTSFDIPVVGVDRSRRFVDEAKQAIAARGARVTIEEASAEDFLRRHAGETFDVVACVGASHALGGPRETLAALRTLTTPRSAILFGEGYWRRRPDRAYLDLLGDEEDALRDLEGTLAFVEAHGFRVVAKWTASEADFDTYEGTYADNIEGFVREHPDDPDAEAMLARIRPWNAGYHAYGRSTLGFALILTRPA